MTKGKYVEKTCIDCKRTVRMYSSAKRCPECRAKHNREYQSQYARELRALNKEIENE